MDQRQLLNKARSIMRGLLREELGLLLAMLAVAGGTWAFIEILDEVQEAERQTVDDWVLSLMRTGEDGAEPIGPRWLRQTAVDLTALGGYPIIILMMLVVSGFLMLSKRWGRLSWAWAAVLGGVVISQTIKALINRPRPEIATHLTEVFSASFPSGHAMAAAVVYLTLGAMLAQMFDRRRFKLFFLGTAVLFAVIVGLTRVYLGVHYPSDVLAGWSLGLAWASLVWLAATLYERRRAARG